MGKKAKGIVFLFVALAFIAMIFYDRRDVHRRTVNAEIVEGIIWEKGHRAKTNDYVAYTFIVAGTKFFGSMPIRFCKECKNECCAIGAKIKVRYEKGNPGNNDLFH